MCIIIIVMAVYVPTQCLTLHRCHATEKKDSDSEAIITIFLHIWMLKNKKYFSQKIKEVGMKLQKTTQTRRIGILHDEVYQ